MTAFVQLTNWSRETCVEVACALSSTLLGIASNSYPFSLNSLKADFKLQSSDAIRIFVKLFDSRCGIIPGSWPSLDSQLPKVTQRTARS